MGAHLVEVDLEPMPASRQSEQAEQDSGRAAPEAGQDRLGAAHSPAIHPQGQISAL